jgi:hypothetical protein
MRIGPFRFVVGPLGLGVGVSNVAHERTMPVPAGGVYGPRYNVRGSLGPCSPAMVKTAQSRPTVALQGNGSDIAGRSGLTQLAQTRRT